MEIILDLPDSDDPIRDIILGAHPLGVELWPRGTAVLYTQDFVYAGPDGAPTPAKTWDEATHIYLHDHEGKAAVASLTPFRKLSHPR